MVCFITNSKPLSFQAKCKTAYKNRLVKEFTNYKNDFSEIPFKNEIYSKIIYIYSKKADIDVDNMSKPFIDAFRNIIYTDDDIINHRICSKIKLDAFQTLDINLSVLPDDVAEKFDEYLQNGSEHIVYFEVDKFDNTMVKIGE